MVVDTEKKSTHRTEIVPVVLEPHPNADSLSIVRIYGYSVCVRTADWLGVDTGAFIVPDSVVKDSPEYAFLRSCTTCGGNGSAYAAPNACRVNCPDCIGKGTLPLRDTDRRIRVRKFRGQMSQGMLVKAPKGSKIGDDVSDILGITRYEPPEPGNHGANNGKHYTGKAPTCHVPVYDVENWYRYGAKVFEDGEYVFLTEKCHGSCWRGVYSSFDKDFFVGSRRQWLKRWQVIPPKSKWHAFLQWIRFEKPLVKISNDIWWQVVEKYPEVEQYCIAHPDIVLFGEVYGKQDLKYGLKDTVGLALFNIYDTKTGLYEFPSAFAKLPVVPIVCSGEYSEILIRANIDGKSLIPGANHIREGIVIHGVGKKLKAVSDTYLERAK